MFISQDAFSEDKPGKKANLDPATGLPVDYQPPRDPPEVMLIEKTLLAPEDSQKYFKVLAKTYQTRIRNGDLKDDKAVTETRNGVRYRLNELTLPKNRAKLTETRMRLTVGDLRTAGKMLEKPDLIREYRRKLLQIIVEETQPLFEFNFAVRVQAALVLGELNLMEEGIAQDVKTEAFPPAAKPLCGVIEDAEQPEGVKIVSVLSLIRILHVGNPNVNQKLEIATAVVSELKRNDTHPWYQTRLAEALGYVDVTLDLDRQPFVFNVLLAAVKDRNRHLRTRVQAAWALGRHPMQQGVDVAGMTVEVAALAYDLAQAQAADPKPPMWRRCAWILYLSFNPKDANDLNAKREREGGLRHEPSAKAAAEEAYTQVLPIVKEMIAEKLVPHERVQELGKWLQAKGYKAAPAGEVPAKAGKPRAVLPSRTGGARQPAEDAVTSPEP